MSSILLLLFKYYLDIRFVNFKRFGNVDNAGLHTEEQINFNKKRYLQWELNIGPLVITSNTFLTKLTRQVLIEGYIYFFFEMSKVKCREGRIT